MPAAGCWRSPTSAPCTARSPRRSGSGRGSRTDRLPGACTLSFADHFSAHAGLYAKARPAYPAALHEWLARVSPGRDVAWDCATGNGQAAVALAERFTLVLATDGSAQQLAQATRADGVCYAQSLAEAPPIRDGSLDLVTVAQALHWFDRPRFFTGARRVLRPRGVLAAWCYGLATVTPEIDAVLGDYYHGTVREHWPPERRLVDEGYAGIEFPFEPLEIPRFEMTAQLSLDALIGYLASWSATRRYVADTGSDPLPGLRERLDAAWGEGPRTVRWPLSVRAGRR